jgi:cellulose synthase/poly-beta-1,6-N-acetylglucosamine synthase-like glycosyltransferase
MLVVLALSLTVLGYVYVGYPVLLQLLVRLRGARRVHQEDVTPPLSLVISAYNEHAVIRRKLENAVALVYPREALEIVVVSDASDDGTDAIVGEFADRGVRLIRQPERRGKTAGLNRTVPALKGDIVVFSDANAIYEPDALLKLARNFADPAVGCVTGEARYLAGGQTAADVGERVYWDYEIRIKRMETALGSMVGGDGAIYAIRRTLWRELPENAINDFLNPLQIVEAGWRGVYEPAAICYEETAGAVRSEYRRRVRIVSRSWRAVFQARGVLNPLRVGLFAWCLVSHKMLRWLSGVFVTLALISAAALVVEQLQERPAIALGAITLGAGALALTHGGRRLVAMTTYFSTIYAASVVGVVKGSFGQVSGVWSTPRQTGSVVGRRGALVPVGLLIYAAIILMLAGAVALYQTMSGAQLATVVFWISAAVLGYVYIGYPLLLALIRAIAGRKVQVGSIEPRVCVFITANDEAAVIEAKVLNTLALDYPKDRLDIVVASDGSVDGTNDLVRAFAPRVQLLEFFPRRGKIAAINEGINAVTADIVVFSDANTFLQHDALRALVRNFADPQVGGVSGDVALVGERASLARSEDLYYLYERWVQRAESEIGSMIGADGALYAIRRELFIPPEADTILDDMAIPMGVIKAGHRVVFEGAARAVEQGSETATEEFGRKSRVIAGAMQFMRRRDSAIPFDAPQVILSLVSHKALRWLSPAFGAAALLSSMALATSDVLYASIVAGEAGLLLLGLAGCVPRLRRFAPVAIAHYFCLLQTAAAYGFLRGLVGRQSVLWERFDRVQATSPVGILHD